MTDRILRGENTMKNTQNNILPFPEELEKRKKKLSILEDFEAINVGKRIKLRKLDFLRNT